RLAFGPQPDRSCPGEGAVRRRARPAYLACGGRGPARGVGTALRARRARASAHAAPLLRFARAAVVAGPARGAGAAPPRGPTHDPGLQPPRLPGARHGLRPGAPAPAQEMTAIVLRGGREKSLRRRHPWIFSGAVGKVRGQPAGGDTVEVHDVS